MFSIARALAVVRWKLTVVAYLVATSLVIREVFPVIQEMTVLDYPTQLPELYLSVFAAAVVLIGGVFILADLMTGPVRLAVANPIICAAKLNSSLEGLSEKDVIAVREGLARQYLLYPPGSVKPSFQLIVGVDTYLRPHSKGEREPHTWGKVSVRDAKLLKNIFFEGN